jgi:DNA-binding MarR family transcriptional regulator
MTIGEKIEAMQANVIDMITQEVAKSRKQGADTGRQGIEIEAEFFVNEQVKAGKLSTAEVAATLDFYQQAAADDAQRPLSGQSRIALLRAWIEARQSADERRRQLLSYTEAGRRALKAA